MQHVDGLGQSSLPHVCWCSKMEIFCETLLIKTSQNSDIYRNRKPGKWKYFAKYFFIKTVQNRDTYIYIKTEKPIFLIFCETLLIKSFMCIKGYKK